MTASDRPELQTRLEDLYQGLDFGEKLLFMARYPDGIDPLILALRELAAARQEAASLRQLAQALSDKLAECEPSINAAFTLAHVHGVRYTGPSYGDQLKALRAALASPEIPKEPT